MQRTSRSSSTSNISGRGRATSSSCFVRATRTTDEVRYRSRALFRNSAMRLLMMTSAVKVETTATWSEVGGMSS